MTRSRSWSPDEGTSAGMKSSTETATAALTVEAETGASTRVKGLSIKFETTKSAMTAKTTFLKERRGLRGVKCILGRSPCELVTSAFALRSSEVGDSYLHIASDARGLGATHGGNDRARISNEHSLSKP